MSNQINPDAILHMTVDDMMEIFIVLNYMKITADGLKRRPDLFKLDVDFCIDTLTMVTERIKERNCVPL
jgi:hypothetical protein